MSRNTLLSATLFGLLAAQPLLAQTQPPMNQGPVASPQSRSTTPSNAAGTPAAPTAQNPTPPTMNAPPSPAHAAALSSVDTGFINAAAVGGLAEVQAGKLAAQHGSDQVKAFGNQMVTDHNKNNQELIQLARRKGHPPPTRVDAQHTDAMRALERNKGKEFDRAYMGMQVSDHERTVALFQRQTEIGNDPDLKAFAQQSLPILQQHLQMARDIMAKL
ncbi:MAG TPA: DUF4142 domain-containing protein [Acetobacteraceae bacterium]